MSSKADQLAEINHFLVLINALTHRHNSKNPKTAALSMLPGFGTADTASILAKARSIILAKVDREYSPIETIRFEATQELITVLAQYSRSPAFH